MWFILRHELGTLPLFCMCFGTIFFDHVNKFGMELEWNITLLFYALLFEAKQRGWADERGWGVEEDCQWASPGDCISEGAARKVRSRLRTSRRGVTKNCQETANCVPWHTYVNWLAIILPRMRTGLEREMIEYLYSTFASSDNGNAWKSVACDVILAIEKMTHY